MSDPLPDLRRPPVLPGEERISPVWVMAKPRVSILAGLEPVISNGLEISTSPRWRVRPR